MFTLRLDQIRLDWCPIVWRHREKRGSRRREEAFMRRFCQLMVFGCTLFCSLVSSPSLSLSHRCQGIIEDHADAFKYTSHRILSPYSTSWPHALFHLTPSPYCTLVPLAFTLTPQHNRQNFLMKHIDPTPTPSVINYAHSFFESAHPHEVRSSLSIAGAQALQTFMFHCTFSPSRVNLTLKSQRLLRLSCNAPHSLALKISTTSPVYLPSPPNKDLLKPTRYSSTWLGIIKRPCA